MAQWDALSYIVWQREKCPTTGRMHLQGYLECKTKRRFNAVRTFLCNGNPACRLDISMRRRTAEEASNYCKKEEGRPYGEVHEEGVISQPEQGARSDLRAFMEAVKAGGTKRELMEEHPEVFARHMRFTESYMRMVKEDGHKKITDFTPRYSWQQDILDMVQGPADERTIVWVYDAWGGSGKTYLSRYLVDTHQAFYTNGGKGTDICYQYDFQKIVIFDYVRDSFDFVNYGVIEQLKNGILTSNKYESCMKRFDNPHVLVFANFKATEGKFSRDRIKLIELNEAHESM